MHKIDIYRRAGILKLKLFFLCLYCTQPASHQMQIKNIEIPFNFATEPALFSVNRVLLISPSCNFPSAHRYNYSRRL